MAVFLSACGGGGSDKKEKGTSSSPDAGQTDPQETEQTAPIDFSQSNYSVDEDAGSIQITVNRIGDVSEPVTVNYSTTGISALEGEDFGEINGTLAWEANDDEPKMFSVQINSDAEAEDDETIELLLSNPSVSSVLSADPTAIITIKDAAQVGCVELSPTDITTDTTLSAPCYNVNENISISDAATLTIKPGVKLVFAAGMALEVEKDGVLIAKGVEQNPVRFTGELSVPGYWDGIKIESIAPTELDHVIVEYAGGDSFNTSNINLEFDGRASINNSLIRHGASYGIRFGSYDSKLISFANNVVTLNQNAPIKIPAFHVDVLETNNTFTGNVSLAGESRDFVDINTDTSIGREITWPNLGVPYVIRHSYLKINAEWTIEPGVTLIMSAGSMINVEASGTLKAIGTVENPITFTGELKAPGWWDGIQFTFNNNANVIDYAIVEYAGGPGGNGSGIIRFFGNESAGNVTNTVIRGSQTHGIWLDSETPGDFTTGNVFEDIAGENIFGD